MMEKIKINKLDPRGTMLIVGIEGKEDHTMNSNFQAQEVDYFMKEVGVGGSVSCNPFDKPDKNNPNKIWHNIKDVDFSSAKHGMHVAQDTPVEQDKKGESIQEQRYRTHEEIIATDILKGAVEVISSGNYNMDGSHSFGEEICGLVNELTGAYELALSNVKAL
jgi:hypothetical protein